MIEEGVAASRWPDAAKAWGRVRERLGLAALPPIQSTRPIEEVPPLRWHRVDLSAVGLEELRGLLVAALSTGFETAAERAAEAIVARKDASPEDRWEALGLLEERAATTVRRLEIIGELRVLARQIKTGDGMLDVAELRVRIERGDQTEVVRLLDHIRREHSGDQRVFGALAEVLMEAGVDIPGMAAGRPAAAGRAPAAPGAAAPAASPATGIWTPGQPGAAPAGEKKTIWTPG
jgi:hypothetical protein